MRPELFRFLDVGFPNYFVLLVGGFAFATAMGAAWARRIGKDPDVVVDLGLSALLAGVAGARLLHVVADGYFWDYVHLCTDPSIVDWKITQRDCLSDAYGGVWDAARGVCHPKDADCWAWAKFWAGGLTYYGGLVTASAWAWWQLRRDGFPFWKAADMAGFVIPVGLGFGRMGCLLAGCCFGVRSSVPWALAFPSNSPASEAHFKRGLLGTAYAPSWPVHPTQVYEAVLSLAIAALLALYIHPRKRRDGQVFAWFLGLYGALRFVVEIWRDDDRGGALGLSTSQILGILAIAAAVAIDRTLARRAARTERAAA